MIELEYIKKGKHNENALSFAFFKMRNPYRDFEKYVTHLKNFFKLIERRQYMKNWTIYMFIDNSVIDNGYVKSLINSNNENLSIIKYKCKEFMLDDTYHDGTFGTVVRFMPLFDYDFFGKHKFIMSSDIDVAISHFSERDLIKMKKNNANILWTSYIYYNKPWSIGKRTMTAGGLISMDIKFPKELLDNYLHDLSIGKYDKIIEKFITNKSVEVVRFQYGTDEHFLNTVFINYIMNNKITFIAKKYVTIEALYKSVYYKYDGKIKELAKKLLDHYTKIYYLDDNEKKNNVNMEIEKIDHEFYNIIVNDVKYKKYKSYLERYMFYKKKTQEPCIYVVKKFN